MVIYANIHSTAASPLCFNICEVIPSVPAALPHFNLVIASSSIIQSLSAQWPTSSILILDTIGFHLSPQLLNVQNVPSILLILLSLPSYCLQEHHPLFILIHTHTFTSSVSVNVNPEIFFLSELFTQHPTKPSICSYISFFNQLHFPVPGLVLVPPPLLDFPSYIPL